MQKIYCEKFNPNDDSYLAESVLVDSGVFISEGDLIVDFETSKANIEVEAEFTGFIYHTLKEGLEIKAGELLYVISEQEIDNFDYSIFLSEESKDVIDDFSIYDQVTFSKGAKDLIKKEKINIKDIIEKYNDQDFISKEMVESLFKDSLTIDVEMKNEFKVKKIAFIGGGQGFTQCLDIVLKTNGLLPVMIYDDIKSKNSNVHGINVKGKIDPNQILKDFSAGIFDCFIVTISTNLGFRAKIFKELISLNIPSINLIHPNVNIGFNLDIGQGNVIFSSVNIGPEVSIGDNNFISSFANIEHHCKLLSNCTFGPGVIFSGSVTVQDNVKFGTGIFCEPNITIGENTIISSGSIITRNVKKDNVLISNNDQIYKKIKKD